MCSTLEPSLPRCSTGKQLSKVFHMNSASHSESDNFAVSTNLVLCSQRESLNVLANNATFRLIEEVLALGVKLREVSWWRRLSRHVCWNIEC